ncbi:MAG: hypothetical protein ACHQ17_12825 [Polyangia bacterium]
MDPKESVTQRHSLLDDLTVLSHPRVIEHARNWVRETRSRAVVLRSALLSAAGEARRRSRDDGEALALEDDARTLASALEECAFAVESLLPAR